MEEKGAVGEKRGGKNKGKGNREKKGKKCERNREAVKKGSKT